MKTSKSVSKYHIRKYKKDKGLTPMLDTIAVEAPIEIALSIPAATPKVYNKSIAITMRTPGQDKYLALGFLMTEGILSSFSQINKVLEAEHKIHIVLHDNVAVDISTLERHFFTTSSCGICGKASLEAIKTTCPTLPDFKHKISPVLISSLPNKLRQQQALFDSTGGIHAAGLFDHQGEYLEMYEDIGRHNALDKMVGSAFTNNHLPLTNRILLLSGRASFELLQKAAMSGIAVVLSVGAPSSMAIGLAEEYGITLLGFVKENGFNVYHDVGRVEL